ncbi:MAG: hypothetical protein QOI89_1199 [Solirubrobacteraceae bacterium]|nr:hypothetical protein [Solirubrobacteraceae bacterium]
MLFMLHTGEGSTEARVRTPLRVAALALATVVASAIGGAGADAAQPVYRANMGPVPRSQEIDSSTKHKQAVCAARRTDVLAPIDPRSKLIHGGYPPISTGSCTATTRRIRSSATASGRDLHRSREPWRAK